mmetsp:Transcript_79661/g.212993  ORF Transcript_79661/g.212993 Transcript_79661/m.212993 type:complete len:450 (+) Transcript_79661:78-1427(+)
MIYYSNKDFYFLFLARLKGTVVVRSIGYALISTLLAVSFEVLNAFVLDSKPDWAVWEHPWAAQMYAIVLGFVLVFRTNQSLNRYWEGMGHFEMMNSKWTDAFMQLCSFVDAALQRGQSDKVCRRLHRSKARLLHWFSLLLAVAVDEVQGEQRGVHMDGWTVIDIDSTVRVALHQLGGRKKPGNRRGSASKQAAVSMRQVTRSFDLSGADFKSSRIASAGICILGPISEAEHNQLQHTTDKALVISKWIAQEITYQALAGNLPVAPPILSRVFQELSNGMLGFNQALKVGLVPFPFPFAHMLSALLVGFLVVSPLAVTSYTGNPPVAIALNFVVVMGFVSLNEISIEIENPFGDDANDLPLIEHQRDRCKSMVEVFFSQQPFSDEDFSSYSPEVSDLDEVTCHRSESRHGTHLRAPVEDSRRSSAVSVAQEEHKFGGNARQAWTLNGTGD